MGTMPLRVVVRGRYLAAEWSEGPWMALISVITASTSMTAAAVRVSAVTGTRRSSLRPPAIASAATAHKPSSAPAPPDTGTWYLAARLAVTIWVRSPNSAARMTKKLVDATRANDGFRPTSMTAVRC